MTDRGRDERFRRLQVEHFARADEARVEWQTKNPYLATTERALLAGLPVKESDRLLEVGCGEGGNLELLGTLPRCAVGVDFSRAKVALAGRRVAGARFVCADAARLPFGEGAFDLILCRDVLHHVADKSGVIGELIRVCRVSGRIVLIEPNGRSPIMWLLGLLVRAERDLVRNSLRRLDAFLDRTRVAEPAVRWAQPFPLGRVMFHYRWGMPRLSAWLAGPVLALERLIGGLVPSDRWAYIILTTVKLAAGKTVMANGPQESSS